MSFAVIAGDSSAGSLVNVLTFEIDHYAAHLSFSELC